MGQLKLEPDRQKIVSDNIRKFITECRYYSFERIAIETDVSTKQLGRWRDGTAIPLERNLRRLADTLGIDFRRLLMTEEEWMAELALQKKRRL